MTDIVEYGRRDLTAGIAVDACRVDEKISGSVFSDTQREVGHAAVNARNAISILNVLDDSLHRDEPCQILPRSCPSTFASAITCGPAQMPRARSGSASPASSGGRTKVSSNRCARPVVTAATHRSRCTG